MRFLSVIILLLPCLASGAYAAGAVSDRPGASAVAAACQDQKQQIEAIRERLARNHADLKEEAVSIDTMTAHLKTEGDELEVGNLKLQREQEEIVAAGKTLDIKQPAGGPLLYENEISGAAQSRKIAVYNQRVKSFNQRHDAHNAQVTAYNRELATQQQRIDGHNATTQVYNEDLRTLRTAVGTYKQRCP